MACPVPKVRVRADASRGRRVAFPGGYSPVGTRLDNAPDLAVAIAGLAELGAYRRLSARSDLQPPLECCGRGSDC